MSNIDRPLTRLWWSGENKTADAALYQAGRGLRARESLTCFNEMKVAMIAYGWEFHPERKARRLWKRWDRINALFHTGADTLEPSLCTEIEELFYAVFNAVHFDKDRRIRRNLPPPDPAARDLPVVPVGSVPPAC
jgi:hypothetical protein